jgi:hypothetical protein
MKITGAKKISSKPIMKEYLAERNKHELSGGFDYYKTGIKKLAEMKAAQKRAKKVSTIADGIALSEQRKDFFDKYR